MMLHLDSVEHDLANKGVWVTTRFLLLTAELSVVAFGCAFGVRESKVCDWIASSLGWVPKTFLRIPGGLGGGFPPNLKTPNLLKSGPKTMFSGEK